MSNPEQQVIYLDAKDIEKTKSRLMDRLIVLKLQIKKALIRSEQIEKVNEDIFELLNIFDEMILILNKQRAYDQTNWEVHSGHIRSLEIDHADFTELLCLDKALKMFLLAFKSSLFRTVDL